MQNNIQDNHMARKIYNDHATYIALCKEHNQPCWNVSDERNFYKHFTYVLKRFGGKR